MDQFYSDVDFEVKHPQQRNNNLNIIALNKIRDSGVEIKTFKMKNRKIGAASQNPIYRLFQKKSLSIQEFLAATEYQRNYELSQISHHARPSYDGTPISAASTRIKEGGPKQRQIDAERYIFAKKKQVDLAANYQTQYKNKKFEIVSLKLPKILELIFEKQIAIRNVETLIHADHRTIQDRIKLICKILLDT